MMRRLIALAVALVIVMLVGIVGVVWFTCRVYVPEDCCAVLIRKMGDTLPSGQLVATQPGQKGIQDEVLGPGRYFRDPFTWDWKIEKLTVIPAGDPKTWEWIHSLDERQHEALRAGTFRFKGEFPQIGVVTHKVGGKPPAGQVIVDRGSGLQGVLREVLTPGTYKINPYVYEVQIHPAVVIPAGFVGVVTNLFGAQPKTVMTPVLPELSGDPSEPAGALAGDPASKPAADLVSYVRPLASPGERGTLRDVLQPGVYFINPKLQKVMLVEVGFNEYSQVKRSEQENFRIEFPSDTGFNIRLGVTVVWGVDPRHAAEVINEFGNIDGVLDKVIGPQLRSICRNIGSTYAARDFIQGEKRELFQRDLTVSLQRICRAKNIEVLLALVREIEVHAPSAGSEGGEVTEDLKRTIQQSHIAIEKQLTKEKQRDAATVKAQLEETRKQVEIARENIRADTGVQVANLKAEGEKIAAEIDAHAALGVAGVQQEVALLDARRTEIMGQAKADVERMKQSAESEGYKLLVEAFGSAKAYNLYTFAENFKPESIRLFFAGDGTFWTDLSRFEEVGAAQVLRRDADDSKRPEPR